MVINGFLFGGMHPASMLQYSVSVFQTVFQCLHGDMCEFLILYHFFRLSSNISMVTYMIFKFTISVFQTTNGDTYVCYSVPVFQTVYMVIHVIFDMLSTNVYMVLHIFYML